MDADLHETVGARLRQVDQRYTQGRRRLVELLARAGRPLSIPEILAGHEHLPQSTVYRNLAVLESVGAVRRVDAVDGFSRYELAEDLTEHHHHLVCTSCGTVADYTPSERLERSMARAIAQIAAGTGFRPESHRLDLVGVCADCG
jgi:Fe2+ or Zn2+ uptake regulation protein